MALSAADIERWSSESVREVFHAATRRADVTATVSRELGTLAVFDTWDGQAAEAARHAVAATRQDLDAHGREALAVARAADRAADGIDSVKADLRNLKAEAEAAGLEVDSSSNKIVPTPGSTHSRREMQQKIPALQAKLDAIIVKANDVDSELASAINMADGDAPVPTDAGPAVGSEGLTPTQIASDANEERMRLDRAATQAQVDKLQPGYDELARQVYMGDRSAETMDALHAMQAQLAPLKSHLADLNAVHDALAKAPETYLTVFDPRTGTGKPVLAAVAVGNPDTASKISVSVPGVGSTTQGALPGMVSEASNLRDTTQRQMDRLGIPGTVASIAWMGYDTPPNPLDTGSPRDTWATMNDNLAQTGATDLSTYLKTVDANNPNAQISLLGHSYGSLTSSLAMQQLHDQGVHAVDNVVFYGSPGLELTSAGELGVDSGHAYVMRAPDDPITTYVAPAAPLHGWGVDPYAGILPELSSQAGSSPDGVLRDGVGSHADYPRPGANGTDLRMSGYNLAAVVAGVPSDQLVMAEPPAMPHIVPGGQVPVPPVPGGR